MRRMSMVGWAAVMVLALARPAVAAEVGEPAPDFTLQDVTGHARTLSEFRGKIVVLEWVNPECPFVKKHYDSDNMQRLQQTAAAQGIVWLSINSSAIGKQGHLSPELGGEFLTARGASPAALLLDSDGAVGHLYSAKTTPHLFVINPQGVLVYAGAIDSIPSTDAGDVSKAVNYVQLAINDVLAGRPVETVATQSYGCSVKY